MIGEIGACMRIHYSSVSNILKLLYLLGLSEEFFASLHYPVSWISVIHSLHSNPSIKIVSFFKVAWSYYTLNNPGHFIPLTSPVLFSAQTCC